MRDDLPNSDVAGQLHDDLFVTWFTDSDNVGFANDLEKGPSVNELSKTPLGGFFYRLVAVIHTSTTKSQFFCLGKWPIDHGPFPSGKLDPSALRTCLESFTHEQHAGFRQFFIEFAHFGEDFLSYF